MPHPTAETGMSRREAPERRRNRAKLEPRGDVGEADITNHD